MYSKVYSLVRGIMCNCIRTNGIVFMFVLFGTFTTSLIQYCRARVQFLCFGILFLVGFELVFLFVKVNKGTIE